MKTKHKTYTGTVSSRTIYDSRQLITRRHKTASPKAMQSVSSCLHDVWLLIRNIAGELDTHVEDEGRAPVPPGKVNVALKF